MKKCYICREALTESHPCYHALCPVCGVDNWAWRNKREDLTGYTALITGARVKIGYHSALRLLRSGASVIATTRFPHSAYQCYANEPDFEDWIQRFYLYGLDLLRVDRLEGFITEIYHTFGALDILINNAAQTVKNQEDIKMQLYIEQQLTSEKSSAYNRVKNFLPDKHVPITLGDSIVLTDTPKNAWVKKSGDVSVKDLLETQIINVTAPYLLSVAFKPLMERSCHINRFQINVSSQEGKFNIKAKSSSHPHTNMAKAALNMMTKTFADEYRRNRIYLYSVDPGWVSDSFPEHEGVKKLLPLDFDDAAARVTHPVFAWKDAQKPPTGIFLKDYKQTEW